MSKLEKGDKVHVVGNSTGFLRDMTKLGIEGVVLDHAEDGRPIVEYTFKFMINVSTFNEEDLRKYG